MGCGASRNTPVFEVSSHDPKYIEVTEAWNKAWKTVEPSRSNNKKVVVRRSGWKTVRVFVSSTFKDFHQEREVLVKKVFPDLRQWCQSRRLHLIECDLRWGVPKDFNTEGTLRACLGEIDRCYQDNIMPFFINMTSERIGWVPTDDEVPESVKSEYDWITGLSVTEMEIMHGAYRKDNPNALFLLRHPQFLDTVPDEHRDAFIDNHPLAPQKLEILKKMISQRFPAQRVVRYFVEYNQFNTDTKVVELRGLDKEFTFKVTEFLKERINQQYPLDSVNTDPHFKMMEDHESFMKNRCDTLIGRGELIDQIMGHIKAPENDVPFLILGGPGSGKSSIVAKVANLISMKASHGKIPGGGKQGWLVLYHFVGAVPGSTELLSLLQRILKLLQAVKDSEMPRSLEKAAPTCAGVLSNPNTRPLIILVDAVNQLDEDICSTLNTWVPRKLAPNVRCVFSMIPDTATHQNFVSREPAPKSLLVTPLTRLDRESIVSDILGRYNKKLDEAQMASILNKASSENPLWLAIACEELRVFGQFRHISDKVNQLADGLLELEAQVLSRFERESGGQLLGAALCLLEVSSRGLLETELLIILADEDNLWPKENKATEKEDEGGEKGTGKMGLLPAYRWADVYRGLRPFLRPFGDSGEGRLDFYHRSFSKAVRKKYFKKADGSEHTENYLWWHQKLADYFEFSCRNINRKVEELPTHLVAIKDAKRLKSFLTDWEVFDLLYDEQFSSKLISYWRQGSEFESMAQCYADTIQNYANLPTTDRELLSQRLAKVASLLAQAGFHSQAMEFGERVIKMEEEELGARPARLADLYQLQAFILDELMKLEEYMYRSQLPRMRTIIDNFLKSIELRKTLTMTEENKMRMGRSYNRLAFYYSGYKLRGGDQHISAPDAGNKANEVANKALKIFQELKDQVNVADCLTTLGVCCGHATSQQIKYYKDALEICKASTGLIHTNTDRLYLNMAIYYEESGDYYAAFDHFRTWYEICMDLYGPKHPKSKRPLNTLREPMYRRIAREKEIPIPEEGEDDPHADDPQTDDPQENDPQAVDPQEDDPQVSDPQADGPQENDPQADDPQ